MNVIAEDTSYWIPNLCIPLVGKFFADLGFAIVILSATGKAENPINTLHYPDRWIVVDSEELPIFVPIYYQGSDKGGSGHYSGPVMWDYEAKPNLFGVGVQGFSYGVGSKEDQKRCLIEVAEVVYDIIRVNCEEVSNNDVFPKISRRKEQGYRDLVTPC